MRKQESEAAGPRAPWPLAGILAGASALLGLLGYALAGTIGGLIAVATALALGSLLGRNFGRESLKAEEPTMPSEEAGPAEAASGPTLSEDRIDTLTGLANENGLMAWFAERIPKLAAEKRDIVVLSASLEGLEPILRSRGQGVVDKVIIEVAHRIEAFASEGGIAARTGGGEFAAKVSVTPEHASYYASEIAARLAEVLQRPVEMPEGVIWIGGCVGAASGPASEGSGVLTRARTALERAKQIGLGHYVVDKVPGAKGAA